jgi:hypothetical protein
VSGKISVNESPCPRWSEQEPHEAHFFNLPFDSGRAHCPGYTKTVRSAPPERYRDEYPEMICPADQKHGWHRWMIEGGTAEDVYLCPGLPRWDTGKVMQTFTCSKIEQHESHTWRGDPIAPPVWCPGIPVNALAYRVEPEQPREGDQPLPVPNDRPSMHDLVVTDMLTRKSVGYQRYGSFLQPFNGRNGLRDLYEELLDAIVYVRQVIEEDNEHLGQATALRAELERRDHGVRRLEAENERLRAALREAGIDE